MSMTPIEKPLMPPTPFVRHVGEKLMIDGLDVLDVGCCIGKSAIYLASIGHNVIGLDPDLDSLKIADRNSDFQNLRFVAADARRLPFKNRFDVILMNEVLYQIPKNEHAMVFKALKDITKPNGIHAISDYIGDKDRALKPGELYSEYANPAWEIIEYTEDPEATIAIGQSTELTSLAKIIAIKR